MARAARIEVFQTKQAKPGYYLRVRAGNGEIIATGAEEYASKGNAMRAAKRLLTVMSGAEVVDKTRPAR